MKNKLITPLHDRVVIKPAPMESVTTGGIIIPETSKEKPVKGSIIASGKGKKGEPMTVKVGDSVLYGKHAGTEIKVGEDVCVIMRESDILAII